MNRKRDSLSFGPWLPYEEARTYVHGLHLPNAREWKRYYRSGQKYARLPTDPDRTYRGKGWTNWYDWLGTVPPEEPFSFEEARAFVHELRLRNWTAWKDYCRSGQKDARLPVNPNQFYREKGWTNWSDWLGTVPPEEPTSV
jgi:hypothetical protein